MRQREDLLGTAAPKPQSDFWVRQSFAKSTPVRAIIFNYRTHSSLQAIYVNSVHGSQCNIRCQLQVLPRLSATSTRSERYASNQPVLGSTTHCRIARRSLPRSDADGHRPTGSVGARRRRCPVAIGDLPYAIARGATGKKQIAIILTSYTRPGKPGCARLEHSAAVTQNCRGPVRWTCVGCMAQLLLLIRAKGHRKESYSSFCLI